MPTKSLWPGKENPYLEYVLILCRVVFLFFQMERFQCNLLASELAKDRAGFNPVPLI